MNDWNDHLGDVTYPIILISPLPSGFQTFQAARAQRSAWVKLEPTGGDGENIYP